jgi:hypothetical protein
LEEYWTLVLLFPLCLSFPWFSIFEIIYVCKY